MTGQQSNGTNSVNGVNGVNGDAEQFLRPGRLLGKNAIITGAAG
jgi:hypothetical protein